MPPMQSIGRPGLFSARNLIAGGIGVVVVIGAWLGIRNLYSDPEPSPQPQPVVAAAVEEAPPPTPQAEPEPPQEPEPAEDLPELWATLLVAKRDIQPGDLLVAEAVEWRPWPHAIDLQTVLVEGEVELDQVLGAVVRLPMPADTPIARNGTVLPHSPGFITAVLAPGHRAVAVQVDGATASAGIIHPGDHVDLTLVYPQGFGSGPVAQVVVSDVRVLAIGGNVLQMRSYGPDNPQGGEPAPGGESSTYTLEVLPRDADRIALAAASGQLSVALRSESSQQQGPDYRQLVGLEEVLRAPPKPGIEAAQVRIIRGSRKSETVVLAPAAAVPVPEA